MQLSQYQFLYYRLNWGCICTDVGNEHILIGSYNALQSNAIQNWIYGWVLILAPNISCTAITPLSLETAFIIDSAVYNYSDTIYLALLAWTGSSYLISLATISNPGTGYVITPHMLIFLPGVQHLHLKFNGLFLIPRNP